MTQAQRTNAPPPRRRKTPAASHDVIGVLAGLELAQDAVVRVIPDNVTAEWRRRLLHGVEPTRIIRHPGLGMEVVIEEHASAGAAVSQDAFEPDARARAVLRGVEYAREDLRDSGGAYDIDQVRTLLHDVSRQAIDKRVKEGSLLVVPGPRNRRRFPTLQFNEDGSVVDGLKTVREALGYSSPWSVLNFLVNPDDGLGGERPIDVLRRGQLARVLESARRMGVQGA